jgi:hypothetical protein
MPSVCPMGNKYMFFKLAGESIYLVYITREINMPSEYYMGKKDALEIVQRYKNMPWKLQGNKYFL